MFRLYRSIRIKRIVMRNNERQYVVEGQPSVWSGWEVLGVADTEVRAKAIAASFLKGSVHVTTKTWNGKTGKEEHAGWI